MSIELDNLVVPSKSRVDAARRLGTLLGVPWAEQAAVGPFSQVYVSAGPTIDFDEWPEPIPQQHCCFRVDDAAFDAILARIQAAGLPWRSSPIGACDYQVNHAFGGRLVYWLDPEGHAWDILTVSCALPTASPG